MHAVAVPTALRCGDERRNHGFRTGASVPAMSAGAWVLLAYRLPREPSTPRIALWRAVRRLGAAQVLDGLVALPADSRTREQLEWLADSVVEAGGQATVWLAQPGSRAQERAIASAMQAEVGQEYARLAEQAASARDAAPGARKRTLGRLRRELRRIRRRDYFEAPQGAEASAAVEALARSLEEVPA
jgi:hypothetical protein